MTPAELATAVRNATWALRKIKSYKDLQAAIAKLPDEVQRDSQYQEACNCRHLEIIKDRKH